MAHGEAVERSLPMPGALAVPWVRRLAFVLAYGLVCWLGRATRIDGQFLSLVWPAAGVGFLWLAASWGSRRDLVVDGALLCVVSAVVNAVTGVGPSLSAALGLANLTGTLIACWAFSVTAGEPGWPMSRPRHLWALLCSAVAGGLASAVVGAVGSALLSGSTVRWAAVAVSVWAFRLTVSVLVVAGAGLCLLTSPLRPGRLRGARLGEALTVGVILLLGYAEVFGSTMPVPLSYGLLPLSVWVGARFGPGATALHALTAGVAVVVLTRTGHGPFAVLSPQAQTLAALGFLAVVTLVSLPLALGRQERQQLTARLEDARRRAVEQAELLDAVIRSTADGLLVVAPDGRVLLRNPRAEELTGTASPVLDLRLPPAHYGCYLPDGSPVPEAERPLGRALHGEEVTDVELLVRRPGAPERILSVDARPLPGPPGERGAVAVLRDVTSTRRAAEEVARARDLLAGVLAAATDQAIVATDPQGRVTLFNEGAQRMLGYDESQVLGAQPALWHDAAEVAHRAGELGIEPGHAVFVQEAVQGRAETRVWTFVARDGRRFPARETVTAMRHDDGAVRGFIAVAIDVTEQVRAQEVLEASERWFRLAFETAPVGMAMASLSPGVTGRMFSVNEALCTFMGRGHHDLQGQHVADFVDAEDEGALVALLGRLAAGEEVVARIECRFRRPDGSAVWGACAASLAPGAGREPHLLLLVEDVTARRDAEERLAQLALHDALTGLPNRTLLADRLEHALSETGRTGLRAGLIYLDLDGFKEVNDSAGHAAGDELLVQVAERLRQCVRPGDTVTRLGGDEFAVVCPSIGGSHDLHAVAARALEVVRLPYELGAGRFGISASVGATVAVAHDTAERVLQVADEAMYAAKRAGKDRIVLRDAGLPGPRAGDSRLLGELRVGLAEGQLVLHGQPIVDLEAGRVVGVETLLRWRHPVRGLLPPVEFLDAAGSSSLMGELCRRVLAEACRMGAAWGEVLGEAAPLVHVNVSGRELESRTFAGDVLDALRRYRMPPDRLVLEVTEGLVPIVHDALAQDLGELRAEGVRLAVDDLGTGSSSLSRLSELPFDVLKIDARVVACLGESASCDALVRAVVGLGRALGPMVVAEGVQTPVQLERLRGYGCDGAQGHLLSPPRPEAELLVLLREWPSTRAHGWLRGPIVLPAGEPLDVREDR
ncbi:PAS domain S-box-containing protein/diguanylate cyclase (GGDEF)-like protein [Kineococcus xinjiangensis]|uniref:PAS domain S-box-containing protein/diguanylate cyclase (GGDEF)-like protein n=1 Tax=Kineococcus xinjiangensis TaxID=512762 RepID=A0A2S6IED3_9ACTN|nr:EAL domain-containing protein [Kineococcus xinjiangensis]PPK92578.1 PAS domain S-box-containing protein/diguanylate cyclase (GGDEF)-like protein [Kineococcus xinjiangensis]